jgi:hypothetical protein
MNKFKAKDKIKDVSDIELGYEILFIDNVFCILKPLDSGIEYCRSTECVEQDCEIIPPVQIGTKHFEIRQDPSSFAHYYKIPIVWKDNFVCSEIYNVLDDSFRGYSSNTIAGLLAEYRPEKEKETYGFTPRSTLLSKKEE